jgi:phosphomannomutase
MIKNTHKKRPKDTLSAYKDNSAVVNDIDGVKIDFPDRWVHLRKSNTEPIIRVYSEAQTMELADDLGKQLMQVVYGM